MLTEYIRLKRNISTNYSSITCCWTAILRDNIILFRDTKLSWVVLASFLLVLQLRFPLGGPCCLHPVAAVQVPLCLAQVERLVLRTNPGGKHATVVCNTNTTTSKRLCAGKSWMYCLYSYFNSVGGHFRILRKWRTWVFSCFVHFLVKTVDINSEKCIGYMASSDSQIDKPQHGRPKRVELPDVNINTGAQSINTERTSLKLFFFTQKYRENFHFRISALPLRRHVCSSPYHLSSAEISPFQAVTITTAGQIWEQQNRPHGLLIYQ